MSLPSMHIFIPIKQPEKVAKHTLAHLKDVLPCIWLDTDPKMKIPNYNNEEIKVMMEYN